MLKWESFKRLLRKLAGRDLPCAIDEEERRKQELTIELGIKMVRIAREALQERTKYPCEVIPVSSLATRLEHAFMVDSEDELKLATLAVCNAEDNLIRSAKNVYKIGIVNDMEVLVLHGKHAIVWEIIRPLTKEECIHA